MARIYGTYQYTPKNVPTTTPHIYISNSHLDCVTLTVGGLAGAVKPEEIAESFARAGAVVEGVELMRDADGGWAGLAGLID